MYDINNYRGSKIISCSLGFHFNDMTSPAQSLFGQVVLGLAPLTNPALNPDNANGVGIDHYPLVENIFLCLIFVHNK
jgi:hypothetical protein